MSEPAFADVLALELRKTEAAHLAQQDASGALIEWPQWYARRLESAFGDAFSYEEFLAALNAAAGAHGAYEEKELGGVRDEDWPQWYAAHMAEQLTGARRRWAANLEALEDWA